MSEDNRTVYERVADCMAEIRQVGKHERNEHFRFSFRGIDAVMNAVGPALRHHKVVVVPVAMNPVYELVQLRNGSACCVRTTNTYRFYGQKGDFFDTVATGEAIDTGDKGTAKANSVALRTCLLQSLCLPTDEPDPDSFSPQRLNNLHTSMKPEHAQPQQVGEILQQTPPPPATVEEKTKVASMLRAKAAKLTTRDQLRELWRQAQHAGVLEVDGLNVALNNYADQLQAKEEQ